jgi:hypothetical protein
MKGMNFWQLCAAGVLLVWGGVPASGQTRHTVQILAADKIQRHPDLPGVQRLIGGVRLGFEDAILTCDSAWQFDDGPFEVMGDVALEDGKDGRLEASRMRIMPAESRVEARGNPVVWRDDQATLEGPSFTYRMGEEELIWQETAQIQHHSSASSPRNLTSNTGRFRLSADQLELSGNIFMRDSLQTLRSDSLHILNLRDNAQFVLHGATSAWTTDGRSEVHADRGEMAMNPQRGWIESTGETLAWARSGSTISAGQHLEWADSTRSSIAGEAFAEDTLDGFRMWGESIELSGDTLTCEGSSEDVPAFLMDGNSTSPATISARIIMKVPEGLKAWPGAELLQDESIGRCDTLVWWEADSVVSFIGQPELWMNDSRLTGDSIRGRLKSKELTGLEARGAVCLTSALEEGPDSLNHAIAGRELDAKIEAGELQSVWVRGNSEVIQFDETGAHVNHVVAGRLRIDFLNTQVDQIHLYSRPEGTWAGTSVSPSTGLPQCPHAAVPTPLSPPQRPHLQSRHPHP